MILWNKHKPRSEQRELTPLPAGLQVTDLHCHLLPGVDDGAPNLRHALELLRQEARRNVREICLTPHLMDDIFETPDGELQDRFAELREEAADSGVRLHLSREYHTDEGFFRRLAKGELLPIGPERTLLLEFDHRETADGVTRTLEQVKDRGYHPLVAHCERVEAFRLNPDLAQEVVENGTELQMNLGSILGWEGAEQQWLCRRLLKQGRISVVASDAHDRKNRRPDWDDCLRQMLQWVSVEEVRRMVWDSPQRLLAGVRLEKGNMPGGHWPTAGAEFGLPVVAQYEK